MKKFVWLCAVAALAACSEAEAPTEADAVEPAAASEAAAAIWAIEAGTYEYTRSDGVSGVNTLAADGRFSNAVSDGTVETGTWGQEGDLSCLTPTEGDKRCYAFTEPDADGNFSGMMENGITATIRKTA